MLQEHLLTALIAALVSMALPSSAFIPERSANIPSTWTMASSSQTEPKATVDHASSAKPEVIGVDGDLQASDTKVSTRTVAQPSPTDTTPGKGLEFIAENVDNDTRFPKVKDADLLRENAAVDGSVPRNVVVIIAETGQNQKDFWKDFRASHSFPVEGMLSSCEAERARFPSNNAMVSMDRNEKHDCEHFLRSNIAFLLLWTRDIKGMTIGTLSNANFTIPSMFGYEESVGLPREFDEVEENNVKQEARKLKPEIRGDWHVIDLGQPNNRVPSLVPAQSTRDNGNAEEAAWNVFDMFSKIRLVLFRSLLESLSGNVATSEDSIPSRKSHLLRSNLLDLIEELKSVENEKGFILVASVSANELNSGLERLQREISQDTLLVVMGACSHVVKQVPFLAQGPSAKTLREATSIWDVPNVIRNIIASGCQDASCGNRRHDIVPPQVPPLRIIPHNVAILRRAYRDTAEKSDGSKKADAALIKDRIKDVVNLDSKDEVKPVVDLNSKDELKNVVNSNSKEEALKAEKNDATPEAGKKNSANFNMAEQFTMFFGTIVSMVAAFVLAS